MNPLHKLSEKPYPSSVVWAGLRWLLLANAAAALLTNAYYLQFLEPAVSRNALAMVSMALAAAALLVSRYGLPGPREMSTILRRHGVLITLFLIVGVAFGFRLWGAGHGLPQAYVPDEYDFVHSYIKMIKRGDFNPHWWIHPSLQAYVNVLTYLIVFLSQVSSGRWHSVHELTEEDMLFWGRFGTGVIPGTLTVLVTFYLGKKMFGDRAGLLAAALMAVFPGAVEVSQYNKPDPLLTLMAPLAVLVVLFYFERGGGRLALASGIVIGLAAAAKYNGGFVFLTFVLAAMIRVKSQILRRPDIYLGALGALAGFFVGCPYFFSEIPTSIDHVADALYNYGYQGWAGAEGVDNWHVHARYTVIYGAGLAAFAFGLVALGLALYRLDGRLAVFLVFPVLYYSFYSSQRINFPGNLIPVYPFLAVLAAYGATQAAVRAAGWVGRWKTVALRVRSETMLFSVFFSLVVALLLWFPVRMSIHHNRLFTLPDTGSLARQWIDARFPPGTHFAVERCTPVLDGKRYKITIESRLINRAVRDYRARGVEYLISSSTLYQRHSPEHAQSRNYRKLFAICPLVAEFEPIEGRLAGPTIRILRVPEEPPASFEEKPSS